MLGCLLELHLCFVLRVFRCKNPESKNLNLWLKLAKQLKSNICVVIFAMGWFGFYIHSVWVSLTCLKWGSSVMQTALSADAVAAIMLSPIES